MAEYEPDGPASERAITMPTGAVQNLPWEYEGVGQEREFRALFENSPDAILLLHIPPDGENLTFIDLNAATCRYLGYSRNELRDMSWQEILAHLTINDRELLHQDIRKSAPGGGKVLREIAATRKDGTEIPMEISLTTVAGVGHTTVLVIARDITERRMAAEALIAANRKLSLVSSITRHDILNQITILKGYLQLMMKIPVPDPRLKKYLQKEERAVETVRQLIGFTSDYGGIGTLEPRWQDLDMSIARAIQSLDKDGVAITWDTGSVRIYADPLLEKVFFNLTENAIRHGGKITRISFSCRETGKGLVIVCEDNGIGIPAEEKENIFCRQYYQHTGLGLSLSRDILSITGLSIRETGTPGAGARFEIIVPPGFYRMCQGGD